MTAVMYIVVWVRLEYKDGLFHSPLITTCDYYWILLNQQQITFSMHIPLFTRHYAEFSGMIIIWQPCPLGCAQKVVSCDLENDRCSCNALCCTDLSGTSCPSGSGPRYLKPVCAKRFQCALQIIRSSIWRVGQDLRCHRMIVHSAVLPTSVIRGDCSTAMPIRVRVYYLYPISDSLPHHGMAWSWPREYKLVLYSSKFVYVTFTWITFCSTLSVLP